MTQNVVVAVVGAGSMAREHIRAFNALAGVKVGGIHSRMRDRAASLAAEFGIPELVCDYFVAESDTGADLVVVAVPELAANTVAKSLCSDWAVLLEKPAGYDLADAQDIAAAAARPPSHGRAQSRSIPAPWRCGPMSKPAEQRFVHVQDQQSFAEARRYKHPEPVVDKFMYANSIHVIDLIPALCRGAVRK